MIVVANFFFFFFLFFFFFSGLNFHLLLVTEVSGLIVKPTYLESSISAHLHDYRSHYALSRGPGSR
jgi:hypothetical protein